MIIAPEILGINGFRNGIHCLEWIGVKQFGIWFYTKFGLYSFERVQ